MIIQDKFEIPSSVEEVWDFFLDIPKVSTCIPGVEKVEQVDDHTFIGSLSVRVGPIAAKFDGKATITELEPPYRLVARAEGTDKRTSSTVSAIFTADLSPTASQGTEVNYHIDVTIRGRLGSFGQGVIQQTAKQIAQSFAACVQEQLMAEASASEPSSLQSSSEGGEADSSPATSINLQPAKPPSLLALIARAVVANMVARIRALWPGTSRPVD